MMSGQAVSDQQESIINYKYSVYDVANYLLHHNTSNFPMTRIRLHTSLYLAYAYFLYSYNDDYKNIDYAMFENKFYSGATSPRHTEIEDYILHCKNPLQLNTFEELSKQDITDAYDKYILDSLITNNYKALSDNEFAAVIIGNDAAYKIARSGMDMPPSPRDKRIKIKDRNIYIYYMSINSYDYEVQEI